MIDGSERPPVPATGAVSFFRLSCPHPRRQGRNIVPERQCAGTIQHVSRARYGSAVVVVWSGTMTGREDAIQQCTRCGGWVAIYLSGQAA